MEKGYTIIEILIVLLILSLFFTAGFISFRGFSLQQELQNSLRSVQSDVRLTQSFASIGRKPSGCVGALRGYYFDVTSTNPARYEISALCDAEIIVKQVSLSSNIRMTRPSINPILFKPLNAGTNLNGSVNMTLTHNLVSSYQVRLTITPAGEIN